ncbi:MAG: N-6 DNA methylase [Planctomycetota bacterium]
MFEQAFRNIDNALRQDAGCTTELDYTEQTSWLLFLKYLDSLEQERAMNAHIQGLAYTPILRPEFQWNQWAAPKDDDGNILPTAATGDDLKDFVNDKLFPYLKEFRQSAESASTIEYKIGEIFSEITNRLQSGYTLRDVIDHVDQLRFGSQQEKHELSELYEAKIKNMGNAGRNGGEYYTPRPLIRAIIKVLDPKPGETIYDPACGSAGFLCEAYNVLREQVTTTAGLKALQESTFFGKEKKSLAYCLGIMNMILHGVEAPNLIHTNTLAENLADVQAKDQFDIILANPPFGGNERAEIRQNFPVATGETAFLFLQHFIKRLKPGGRAGVVIKNTFLSNADTASKALRHQLLTDCNLFAILDCPQGTFQGAGVKTVVLFFEKGRPTDKTWYYQLDPGRKLGKTNPLNDDDLTDFVEKQKNSAKSDISWSIDGTAVAVDASAGHDLSVKNPNAPEAEPLRDPAEIIAEIKQLDEETTAILEEIGGML